MDGGGGLEELVRILEARSKEIDSLKRQLSSSERLRQDADLISRPRSHHKTGDLRQQLEMQKSSFDARQPPDVQSMLSKNRELKTQLEREESEKHELFSQINQLIGELDETKSARGTDEALHKAQLNQLNLESEELKRDFARKEAAFQKLSAETAQLRSEMERRERIHQLEKSRMEEEIGDCQRDIRMKEAAIQSFSLARQTTSNNPTVELEMGQLREENEGLRQELAEKDDLLKESIESNDALTESLTGRGVELESLRSELERLKAAQSDKCDVCEKSAVAMTELRGQLSIQAAEHTETVQRTAEENSKLRDHLSTAASDLSGVRGEIERLRSGHAKERDELTARLKSTEAELNKMRGEAETCADDKHSELLRELQELRASCDEKTRQLAILEIQSEKALVDLRAEIVGQLARVLNPDDQSGAQRLSSEDDLFGRVKALVSDNQSSRAKLAEMGEKLAIAEAHSAHLSSQLADVRANSDKVEKAMRADTEKEVQRLNQLLDETETNCSTLREEKVALHERLTESARVNDSLKTELIDARSKLVATPTMPAGVSKVTVGEDSHSSSSTTSEADETNGSATTVTNLNRRLSELMSDNARLAGDLLKQQSNAERGLRDAVASEKVVWARERHELETALNEARRELDAAKSSNNADPIPKPRKLLNGGGEAATTVAESDEIGRLRSELEKQKRIVTVLRKKLQPAALATTPKPLSANASEDFPVSTSQRFFNSGAPTLPRR